MATNDNVIGFAIKVTGTDTEVEKLAKIKVEIFEVEKNLSKLNASSKNNSDAFAKNSVRIVDLQTQLKNLRGEYSQQEQQILKGQKANDLATGSYNELSAQLYLVAARQKELTAAERDDANIGGVLIKQRVDLTNQLKSIDAQNGVFTRNVGNYSQQMTSYANTLRGLRGPVKLLAEILGISAQEADQFRIVLEHSLQGVAAFTKGKEAATVATEANTAATGEAAVADEVAAVAKTGLVGWIVAGTVAVVALVAAIYDYTRSAYVSVKLEEEFSKALEETTKETSKQQDEIKKLGIEYDVLSGKITEFQGKTLKQELETDIAKRESNKKYSEQRKELLETSIKEQEGWFGSLMNMLGAQTKTQLDIQKQFASEDNSLKIAHGADILNLETENKAKLALIREEENNEKLKKQKEANDKYYKEEQAALEALRKLVDTDQKEALKANAFTDQQKLDQERNAAMDELQTRVDLAKQKGVNLIEITRLNNEGVNAIDEEYDAKQKVLDAKIAFEESAARDKNSKESLEKYKEYIKYKEQLAKSHHDSLVALEKQEKELIAEIEKQAFAIAAAADQAYFQTQQEKNARDLQQTIDHLNLLHDTEISSLQARLSSQQITQAQFDIEAKLANDKFEADQLQAKKEAFEKDKELKEKQILVELALGIIKIAVANADKGLAGVYLGIAEAAGLVAIAGVQISAIESQQFAKGGVLNGKSHAQGGIPFTVNGQAGFEAEGGEALINKRSTAMYRPLLSAINEAGGGRSFAFGGQLPVPPLPPSNSSQQINIDMESFANRIVNGINSKKVVVLESDIRASHNRINVLESETTF